jgi:hypothetical protein
MAHHTRRADPLQGAFDNWPTKLGLVYFLFVLSVAGVTVAVALALALRSDNEAVQRRESRAIL